MHEICSRNTTRCGKLCLTSFCAKNYLLPNFKDVVLKNSFCLKSAKKIQLALWNLCLTSFCVKNYLLPNYRHVLLKNAFCMKSAQGIQLAMENCVWLDFVLKTTFCQILSMSCSKMRFAWNLLKKYNSLFENCVWLHLSENYLLPNYKHVLLKNAFCMKSAQKIQLAVRKLCLTSFCVKN